jgi:hypothetical protein
VGDISRLPLRVLVVRSHVDPDEPGMQALAGLIVELEELGVDVLSAQSSSAGCELVKGVPDIHAALIDYGLDRAGDAGATAVVDTIRSVGDRLPIFLMSDRESLHDIPTALVARVAAAADVRRASRFRRAA